jgi:WhiB family redox-sensing transcriptional regulator
MCERSMRASCHRKDQDPELWFPDATLGSEPRRIVIRRAKAICQDCPSRAACLQMALDAEIQHGIWGGLTERERRRLSRGPGQ